MSSSPWHDRFLGLSRLPPRLSDGELAEFFTLSAGDVAAIQAQFRPKYRIAAGIQLGFVRMTGGRLAALKTLPRNLLGFIGKQVGEPAPSIASLRSLYRRQNTRYEHQAWAMQRLHIRALNPRQERHLFADLKEASKTTASRERLMGFARQWLYERKVLVPRDSTLRDLVDRAARETEKAIYEVMCEAVSASKRAEWFKVLVSDRGDGRTVLEWLQRAPQRRMQKNFRDLTEKIQFLRKLGVDKIGLSGVPQERLAQYALALQHRKPSRFATMAAVNRTLLMVAFLKVTLGRITDVVIDLANKKTSDIFTGALRAVQKAHGATMADYHEVLHHVFELVADESIDAETLRAQLRELAQHGLPETFPSHAAAVRAKLAEGSPAARVLIKELAALGVRGHGDERAITGLKTLVDLYNRQQKMLPEGTYDCAGPYRALVNDQPDRKRALHAYEAATLYEIRRGFRSGRCWVDYSTEHRNREELLIPAALWKKDRKRHYAMLKLPLDPEEYRQQLLKEMEEGLQRVAAAVKSGELKVVGNEIRDAKLGAEPKPPGLTELSQAIDRALGDIQLPELLLQMDVMTRFSKVLLGGAPASDRDLLRAYAGLLALGTDMDVRGVSLMIPGLREEEIAAAMQALEREDAIGRANRLVLDFIARQPVSAMWGTGDAASSDMMSLQASRQLWNSRRDPRRQTPSIGIYTHVQDRWPIIYQRPYLLRNREAGPAIEGVVRQYEIQLAMLAVDTHGYTDAAMGYSRGLGFLLCPRIKALKERRLTVPRGMAVPAGLESVVDRTLSLGCIDEHWDDHVRIIASISNGTCSAVTVLERYGSAAQGDHVYLAAKTIGRMVRTIYLCRYHTDADFRRHINRLLSRGESVHRLQRAVFSGQVADDRGRRKDELIAISGALNLVANLAIAWTTHKIQTAIPAIERQGIAVKPELMFHISPIRHRHINFRGVLEFPLKQYRDQLLAEPAERSTVGRA